MTKQRRAVLLIAAAATLTLGLASCLVAAEPAPTPVATVTVGTDYYSPMYYDGYVVYYDAGGRPYYYLNGGMVWIPATDPLYGGYTGYYAQHRNHYWRWHRSHGNRYRNYRRRGAQRQHRRGVQTKRRQPAQRGPSGGRGSGGGRRR
ncbi:MAG: hypothetical protein ABI333_03915 [bacterium]